MKTQPALTLIATAIALSLPVALAPHAQAAGIVRGSTATSTLASNFGTSPANVTNQSGLSASYVSGTTDFDSYVATTNHNSIQAANNWFASPTTGFVTFDLGASYTLDALALWPLPLGSTRAIRGFTLYADTDANPTNPGTSLGNFNAVNPGLTETAQVFNFAFTTTRYIQLLITSNAGNASSSGFGEVAFREVPAAPPVTTPEPSALVGLGAVIALGLGLKRRRG
jgi:hypothetical protein